MSYVKLFGSILASTIWREPPTTRVLWITMLAMADRDGVVEASVPGLADLARLSIDECRRGLASLEGPDPDSRTIAHEGRRIAKVDGGWLVLNYEFYRDKQTAEHVRALAAARKARQRDRQRDLSRSSRSVASVTPSGSSAPESETQIQPSEGSSPQQGSGGEGSEPRVLQVLLSTSWRSNSQTRILDAVALDKRLVSEGMTPKQCSALWALAQKRGRSAGGYFDKLTECEANWRSALEQMRA